MPPFIPHPRRFSPSPPRRPAAKSVSKPKSSLFDAVDKPGVSTSLHENQVFLDQLHASDSGSSLSDIGSDDFENVLQSPASKRRKTGHVVANDDDEVDWQDALEQPTAPEPSGDLELTLDNTVSSNLSNRLGKKNGPSKIERQIRVNTHCMHVQFLLFHNLVRNGWSCDKEVQEILVRQMPANVKKEVDKWKLASGIIQHTEVDRSTVRQRRKGKKMAQSERTQRDWGEPAQREEKGVPNMSRGDPIIRLLKVLAAYWKKRWTITAPGLRKQGYKPLVTLEEEITSYKNDKHDRESHGERIQSFHAFRDLAKKCEGSRDAGAQLFTALVRGLGIEARLIASLQPIGFGWSKGEEASIKKKAVSNRAETDDLRALVPDTRTNPDVSTAKRKDSDYAIKPVGRKSRSKGAETAPVHLSEESGDGSLKSVESDDELSVTDVTPVTPRRRANMNYDRDIGFPTYWTECVSPITHEVYPVDTFFLNPPVATNADQLPLFESRGPKADQAKQVFAYIVGFSTDGTAKDMTTRYLKRHLWPGRTKGVRIPIEKVPVYDHRGKIKRHEDYDWFKTVMSGYSRTDIMRTAVDDLEEAKDLKATEPEKKELKAGEDTLQGYKSSAEFVLERHLRREEAIRPGSEPVKTFITGKGDNTKEELVYLRKYVEVCRTGESWYKEGRAIKAGEPPMKMVPVRAVTLMRKREVEEAERDSGEKLKQGLYAWDQTDWIIPPPIQDGIIPKNAFGNMDCYVPTMVPKGAVHIPLRSTAKICKNIGIDYAEAVTGFEFGNKRAVPVITGVVVAAENEDGVMNQWEHDEEERKIKEAGKREKAALATWRKWLMGLRIIERVREEYGGDADAHIKEGMNPFTNQSRSKKDTQCDGQMDHTPSGKRPMDNDNEHMSGGFLLDKDMRGGGFLAEGHDEELLEGKYELTVEGEAPASHSPPAFAQLGSNHFSAEKRDELSAAKQAKSEPMVNGIKAKRPDRKPKTNRSEISHPSAPILKSKKRKAFASPDASNHEGSEMTRPIKREKRAAPKRKAARKSESGVKSHYFGHASDEEAESMDGDSDREDGDAEEASAKIAGKGLASERRKSLRIRKKTK